MDAQTQYCMMFFILGVCLGLVIGVVIGLHHR